MGTRINYFFALLVLGWMVTGTGTALDLGTAGIVNASTSPVITKATRMLQEEIEARCGITMPVTAEVPQAGVHIWLGLAKDSTFKKVPEQAEGYAIVPISEGVALIGRDERGLMFAVGHLVRLLDYGDGSLHINLKRAIHTAPDTAIRVHQLGYRNTANTYDAWSLETFDRYIRDLMLFGCNGIELITGLDPEKKSGPIMDMSVRTMNKELSSLIDGYGMDVWLWSPVMANGDEDVTTPESLALALEKRRALFEDYPAIDHLFVPGGDDGDAPARDLMVFLEAMAPILHDSHPEAKIWVSNQTFTLEENDFFFETLASQKPEWLAGLVYGPWVKMSWEEMRERTPAHYPIRRYPDINHTVRCQYPIPDWDTAFANTLGREPVMPMPEMQRHIYLRYRDVSDGFGTYSDGVHDDLNKHIWNVLGWDPDADLDDALLDYGKVFFGDALAKDVAEGLRMLEANWQGPILENDDIAETLEHWESIAERVAQFDTHWRAQMYLLRARHDAYVQSERRAQQGYESQAYDSLALAASGNVKQKIETARKLLAQADTPADPALRASIESLGPMLLKSIGYQLSVEPPYLARNPERGAVLDWLDQPLNDRPWLEQQLNTIEHMAEEADQLERLATLVNWTDPGPGGYYENLGAIGEYHHVVYQRSWAEDPSGNRTARPAFPKYKADQATIGQQASQAEASNMVFKEEAKRLKSLPNTRQELRMSWQSQITTLYGTPLKMRFDDLDPDARYELSVTYAGRFRPTMVLTLNDEYSIHGPLAQPSPIWPVTYNLPRGATASGTLNLEWNLVDGRGCMISEVWLRKITP